MEMEPRRRKNIRLRGYDYSEPGAYFVTICTKDRACILGEIVDGTMRLSDAGKTVEAWWKDIPAHFPNTRCDVLQIMPNHVHGIVEIKEKSRKGEVASPKMNASPEGDATSPPRKISLGRIVAYFKYQASKYINEANRTPGKKVFQRNYHDRIIRSDAEYFFVERYITLNPLLWHLDSDNPDIRTVPVDELKRVLRERHGLDDHAIDYLVDCEMNYRG
ncbi:MAG: hypothetical protein KF749_03580 [Bacteroidetes bacterium]|nr:hypothetical protein [Bacteroidota bacterium]